ncbi:MAG TPA: hypothetical protein VFB35_07075 [Gaiellaceae bacterium]|jgi:hypothetical protein|nr:hypothetical protein [Gaiellaceae bacterium]
MIAAMPLAALFTALTLGLAGIAAAAAAAGRWAVAAAAAALAGWMASLAWVSGRRALRRSRR